MADMDRDFQNENWWNAPHIVTTISGWFDPDTGTYVYEETVSGSGPSEAERAAHWWGDHTRHRTGILPYATPDELIGRRESIADVNPAP